MNLDVLLTDGHYKHTYAMARALKSKNLKVGVLCSRYLSMTLFSRIVDKKFLRREISHAGSAIRIAEAYSNVLLEILTKIQVNVLLPVGNLAFHTVSSNLNGLTKLTHVAIADEKSIAIAQDKRRTFKFAESIGVPAPKTYYPQNCQELSDLRDAIHFPCVLKKANYDEGGVVYCNNFTELSASFARLTENYPADKSFPIIQEYIRGKGFGFYALFDKGKCISYFMHERLHEFPITGGASTFAKSFYDRRLLEAGLLILETLNWHGVAMVEFKKDDSDGEFKLMEINPKYWGSLELSFQAGINFPYLHYLLALNRPIPESSYTPEVYFRWVWPHDVLWSIHSSRTQRAEFRKLRRQVVIHTDVHFDDPLVVGFNVLNTGYKIIREKKYPHGLAKE